MRMHGAVLAAALIVCCPSSASASCSFGLRIGTIAYDAFADDGGRFSGLIEIDCSPSSLPATAQIALDGGGSGDPLHRAMRGEAGTLAYQVYLPGGAVFGDGSGDTNTATETLTSQRTLVPFIGTIFSRQAAPPGMYQDELSVTLSL
jgi:spore coat protein U-like protein